MKGATLSPEATTLSPGAQRFLHALLNLDRAGAENILREASAGQSILASVESAVVPALDHIGQAWANGTMALSQLYMAGRISEQIISTLFPEHDATTPAGHDAAICIFEDYHALGKRIVLSMLRSAGFRVLDYGRQTLDELVSHVERDQVRVLLCSVLMLRSAMRLTQLKTALQAKGLPTTLVVGGAPFRYNPQLAVDCGADHLGITATDAISILMKLTHLSHTNATSREAG